MSIKDNKVSIVIPTFEREVKYLSRALDSLKIQTYKNIEVVVVDDNPPTSNYRVDTKRYMENYKNDSNVIYIKNKKNLGGSLARNVGINIATGDYITFLDDDDKYQPNKVGKQLNYMMENSLDMSFTDLIILNSHDITVDYREHSKLKKFDKNSLLKYHIMHHLTGTPTFMYKAEKLKAIGGFEDAIMGQEFYLMMKTIENDLNIGYLPVCDVIAYRHSDSGISRGKNKLTGEDILYRFKKQHFNLFTAREKMFIRFRHYAVLAVAYRSNNNYIKSFLYSVLTILSSPIDFINESINYVKKYLKINKEN